MRQKSTKEWTRLFRKYKRHFAKAQKWASAHNVGFYDPDRLNKAEFKIRYRLHHEALQQAIARGERKSMPSVLKSVLGSQKYFKTYKEMKAFNTAIHRYNDPKWEKIKNLTRQIRQIREDYRTKASNEVEPYGLELLKSDRDDLIDELQQEIEEEKETLLNIASDWRYMWNDLRPGKDAPKEFWDFLSAERERLLGEGMSSKQVSAYIAQNYFGSPK